MSVRTLFGARFVAVTGLAAVIALAGCSASPVAGTATATPVARTAATATPIIAPAATAPPVQHTTSTSQLTVDCDAFARQPKDRPCPPLSVMCPDTCRTRVPAVAAACPPATR
jgi:hypothetical protein